MDIIEFNAAKRTLKGNGPARRLRREGLIPAVIYGPKMTPEMLSVDSQALTKVLKTTSAGQALLNLNVEEDTSPRTVMIKELQRDVVSRNLLHVDFYEVDMNRKIRVKVPVIPVGKCKGVEMGGLIQVIRRELEVLCFPADIPESIEIDVTDLDVNESIHVEEIPLEGDMEIPADVNFTVITVLTPKVVEEEEEELEEGEEGVEEGAEEEAAAGEEE